ncbi:helix-turn-helix domain-containing protein [Thermaurantimonas aggregans]|uniref:helix-turn-helix domain-containing protein n=1 Tax=Thermaurantimonas aggregans TaxID=2173829 RepID=UPI0023F03D77|nr:helix-turn-helix transcriptional regulator [Thermaurantimonas aggregans]MCX8148882.1 helix-turn-helix domain-containing protein [Thermaurantimonas aggregans]
MKTIVDRIKELQQAQGLTNNEFAEKLGISSAALSHIYSGRNNPSLTILEAIYQKFPNVNFNYLLKGQGNLFEADQKVNESKKHIINDLFSSIEEFQASDKNVQNPPMHPIDDKKSSKENEQRHFTDVNIKVNEFQVVKVALFTSDGRVFFFTPSAENPFL